MIDRDAVIEILTEGSATHGDPLTALEAAGYRVVRAGMVPQLGPLDEVEQMLANLGHISGRVHSSQATGNAAHLIRDLRELALMVLGIDRDDIDVVDLGGDAQ